MEDTVKLIAVEVHVSAHSIRLRRSIETENTQAKRLLKV